MLRLLHTSDWHLGHTLHGIDRKYEHGKLLAWLAGTAETEAVDAILISGDVFDAANPPIEAHEIWCRFLVDLWKRLPHLQIVVIGGNHDSAARLQVTDPFLQALGRLHVVGGVSWKDGAPDLSRLIVPLKGRDDTIAAWVAAVPYLRASETGTGGEDAVARATARFYDSVFAQARAQRSPGQAIVAMGHLHMVGGKLSELSERKLFVGNQSAVPAEIFPNDLAYAALGHLHLAQSVGGRDTIRYAGSLLPLSLKERAYKHEVVLVDLEGDTARDIRSVPLPRFVPICRIPEIGALPIEDVLPKLRALPDRSANLDAERPLLEVCVEVAKPEPTLRQTIEAALEGKDVRLVRYSIEQTGTGRALGDEETRSIADLQPEDVFLKKYQKEFNGPPSDDLLQAFHEILREVEQEAG